jgi:hypothetical protein
MAKLTGRTRSGSSSCASPALSQVEGWLELSRFREGKDTRRPEDLRDASLFSQ